MRISAARSIAGTVRNSLGPVFMLDVGRGLVWLIADEGRSGHRFITQVRRASVEGAIESGLLAGATVPTVLAEVRGLPGCMRVAKNVSAVHLRAVAT